jgi:hypothetical protein
MWGLKRVILGRSRYWQRGRSKLGVWRHDERKRNQRDAETDEFQLH